MSSVSPIRPDVAAAEEGAPLINVHATGALLAALIGAQVSGRFDLPPTETIELRALELQVRIARAQARKKQEAKK